MIAVDLQKFGGRGSSSGGGGAGGGGTGKSGKTPRKKETYEETVKRITNSDGNVKTIANGLRYNIISANDKSGKPLPGFDNLTAAATKEYFEDMNYSYDDKTGTFTNGYGSRYIVKVSDKKKKK